MKEVKLKPITEGTREWEALEKRLKLWFKEMIYLPLIKQIALPKKVLKNAKHPNALMEALYTGQITYNNGVFSGRLNASISKALREIGAQFRRKEGTYYLPASNFPDDMRLELNQVILASSQRWEAKLSQLDQKLASVVPEELASAFQSADLFDKALWRADESFKENVKNITVAPTLTDYQRKELADKWQDNMKLYIKNWTEQEIKELRAKVRESSLAGNRYGSLVQTIQDSYKVSQNKAEFLARQETRLMMETYKQAKYVEAGSHSYIWRCVKRPHDEDPKHHTPGNVRFQHGKLDGTEQFWSSPPVTTNPGQPVRRNHPGTDFNCRCYAQPQIRVKS